MWVYNIGSRIVNSNCDQADVFHAHMFQDKFLSQNIQIYKLSNTIDNNSIMNAEMTMLKILEPMVYNMMKHLTLKLWIFWRKLWFILIPSYDNQLINDNTINRLIISKLYYICQQADSIIKIKMEWVTSCQFEISLLLKLKFLGLG